MIRRVALEGIDGSGKTTVTEKLATMLRGDGLTVAVHAPYRLAATAIGQDLYPLWSRPDTAKAAIGALHEVLDGCEQQARDEATDVVIYDRHWMTAFTEIADNAELVEAWGDYFVPAAWLRVDPRTASARLTNDRSSSWSGETAQGRYSDAYDRIARANFGRMLGIYRSDHDVSPDALARAVSSDLYLRR